VFYAGLISESHPGARALTAAREGLRQAEATGCTKAVAYSLNTVGLLRIGAGDDGFADIARSLGLALEHDLDDEAGRGYANLYQAAVDRFRFAEYARCFTDGMAFSHEHDAATYGVCLRGSHAAALLRTGRLAETTILVEETLRETVSPVNRLHLLISLAAARLLQGDPGADAAVEEAWSLATSTGERGWLLRMASLTAGAAWLAGRADALDERVIDVAGSQADDEDTWLRAELIVWLDRLGIRGRRPARPPTPYALELNGDHEAAARWWHEAGCPFEEAVALTRASSPGHLAAALELVTSIGAEQAAARVRRMMRDAGERAVPRGARPATRANPHGLTPREVEVLALLREGLSNAAIARRLYISERTVHHHVSAVLAKLGISSRTDVHSLVQSG
jgi:DNA-binding CsgD family transcriptional regulator